MLSGFAGRGGPDGQRLAGWLADGFARVRGDEGGFGSDLSSFLRLATGLRETRTSCAARPRGLRPVASRRKEPLLSNSKANLALYAHTMKLAPTDSEAQLWRALRASQLGVAFRRQVPLLGFIADFYAPSVRLVVEVDGGYHARRVSADARRDSKLVRAGYRVLRIEATRVMRELSAVVAKIAAACAQP